MRSRTLTTAGLGAAVAAALTPVALPVAPAAAAATTRTYKGKLERTVFSDVRVSITVRGRSIRSLAVTANPQSQESYVREAYALPRLRKEVLKTQSFRIHMISGVTITSDAFILSLYSAMGYAHLR